MPSLQEIGQPLEDAWSDFIEDWSPTPQEFVYSFVPTAGNIVPTTSEQMLYWDLKAVIAIAPAVISVFYYTARGATAAEAVYLAGNSFSLYKTFTKVSKVARYGPWVAMTYLGATEQHEAMSESGSGVRGTGSPGASPSHHLEGGKPWWES